MGRTKFKIELPPTAAAAKASSRLIPHSSSPPPPWIELPEDVTTNILQRLSAEDILKNAQKVCTTWRKVCKVPAMWRVIHLKNWHDGYNDEFILMCLTAVNQSQGQLIEISIANFEDCGLISYVAYRSRHLRRLTLENCDIPGPSLIEALNKLPELEELHLIKISAIDVEYLETIGITCPMLKSFTYNELFVFPERYYGYYHALAIGRSFPNLLHLRLFAHHQMENKGLEAILDGCPHLESLDLRECRGLDLQGALGKRLFEQSLDLRECRGLDLQGALGKRLFEQIKDVRLPSESISEYEWPPTEDNCEEKREEREEEESDDTMSTEFDWGEKEESDDTMSTKDDCEEDEEELDEYDWGEKEDSDDTMSTKDDWDEEEDDEDTMSP